MSIPVQIGKRKVLFPVSWNLFTERELIICADVLQSHLVDLKLQLPNQEIVIRMKAYKHKIVRCVLGVSWRVWNKLTASQVFDTEFLADFIFKDIDITRLIIPKIKCKGSWFGPKYGFYDLTGKEFAMADKFYMDYRQHSTPESLDKLVAVLYRKKGNGPGHDPRHIDFCGDIREKFNPLLVSDRARLFAKVSEPIRYAIFLQYWGWRKDITNKHPNVFPKQKEKSRSRNFGWMGVMVEMSGNKFGALADVENTKAIDLIGSLEMEMVREKERKDKEPKLKKPRR